MGWTLLRKAAWYSESTTACRSTTSVVDNEDNDSDTGESILCGKEESPMGFEIRNLERFASEFLVKYPLVEGIFFWALGILCLTETMSNPRDIKPASSPWEGSCRYCSRKFCSPNTSEQSKDVIVCKNYSYQLPTGSRTRNWDAILGVYRSLPLPRAEGWN